MIGIIAAIVLPALSKSRQKAMAAESLENSRAIGAAFKQYANDHDGALVPVNPIGKNAKSNWARELNRNDQAYLRPAAAAAAPWAIGRDVCEAPIVRRSSRVPACPVLGGGRPAGLGPRGQQNARSHQARSCHLAKQRQRRRKPRRGIVASSAAA